jgi:ribosomal protein L29
MAKKEKVSKKVDYKNMDLMQSRQEFLKLSLALQTGKERNTSLKVKLKKHIARLLTTKNLTQN